MLVSEVEALIVSVIPGAEVHAQIDGSHVHVSVVSEAFAGLSAVRRQQLVYSGLQQAIASGAIHAVHIKALCPGES